MKTKADTYGVGFFVPAVWCLGFGISVALKKYIQFKRS